MLKPFIKKTLETPETVADKLKNNIDAAELPATPILNLLKLTNSELNDLQVAIESELLSRELSQNVPDLSVS
jgi:hypothetical protein